MSLCPECYRKEFAGSSNCSYCGKNYDAYLQSIAERVCEVLRIEVGNIRLAHEQFDPSTPGMSLLEFEKFLAKTRDWAAILSEKEEK